MYLLRMLLLGFVFGASATLTYKLIMKSQPKVAKYDIFEEAAKSEKHHPIIRINRTNNGKDGGKCTAFVISDTQAMTAAHCFKKTKLDVQERKEKALKRLDAAEKKLIAYIVELENTCPLIDPQCARLFERSEAQLADIARQRKSWKKQEPDEFKVHNVYAEPVNIKVVAYDVESKKRDVGLLEGDFKSFNKIKVRYGWHVKDGDTLSACGFFGGKSPPLCTDFVVDGTDIFYVKGKGLLPGVSGGPVLDSENYVVGIAVKVSKEYALMEPILGTTHLITDVYREREAKRQAEFEEQERLEDLEFEQ